MTARWAKLVAASGGRVPNPQSCSPFGTTGRGCTLARLQASVVSCARGLSHCPPSLRQCSGGTAACVLARSGAGHQLAYCGAFLSVFSLPFLSEQWQHRWTAVRSRECPQMMLGLVLGAQVRFLERSFCRDLVLPSCGPSNGKETACPGGRDAGCIREALGPQAHSGRSGGRG